MTTEKKSTYTFTEIFRGKGLFISKAINSDTSEKFVVFNKEKRVRIEGSYGDYMVKNQSIWVPLEDFKSVIAALNASK